MATGYKTGGRTAGTPNKITSDHRERINNFLSKNWDIIENEFQNLETRDQFIFFEKLIQYTVPKLKTVENVNEDEIHLAKIILERQKPDPVS